VIDHEVGAMTKLTDEQRRALQLLARHLDGCDEAVLVAEGFSVSLLAVLVIDGFAKMRTVTRFGRKVVWMEITEEGRKSIAE
jgi:hypothetical protein